MKERKKAMSQLICQIVGAGAFFLDAMPLCKKGFLIAADGGYQYVKQHHLKPDLVIGDFDSCKDEPKDVPIRRLPREKEDTDLFAAIKEGLKRGCTVFHIYGATGGRLDHTIANLQLVAYLAKQKKEVFLCGENQIVTAVFCGEMEFGAEKSGYISVFAFGQVAQGVCIKGLKYELDHAVLEPTIPIGVSNEFIGQKSTISVEKGLLLITYDNSIPFETC